MSPSIGVLIVGVVNLFGIKLERGLIARFFHFASLCFVALTCLGSIYFKSGEVTGFARKVFIEDAIEKGVQVVFLFTLILTLSAIFFRKMVTNNRMPISLLLKISDKRHSNNFYLLSACMICLYIFTIYPSQILSRSSHLVETPVPQIRSMHGIFIILGIVFAVVPLIRESQAPKNIGFILLILWLTLAIANESRSSLIVLAAFMYLSWVSSSSRLFRFIVIVFTIFAFFVVYFLITVNRNAVNHGLLHMFQTPFDRRVFTIWFENLAFVLPVIGYTALVAQPSPEFILTSLNPLPGGFAGWGTFIGKSAISNFVPFSGLGLSYAYGITFFLFLWTLVFTTMAISIRIVKHPLFRIPVLLSFGLALTLASQYELRSSMRYIYFGVAISILQLVLKKDMNVTNKKLSTGETW